jgi:hypothetical protein
VPTSVSIDSLATEDVTPAAAPYRISDKPGKDHADFAFTPTHDGHYVPCAQLIPPFTPGVPAPILAVKVMEGGVDPYTGTEVGRLGLVCSDSEPCSDSLPCSGWESPSGTQLAEDVTYPETGAPADGSQTINVWVCTDRQGWS